MHNQNYENALNWLVEHIDEPDPDSLMQQCILRKQCTFAMTGTK